jgi:hypothetical protein
MIYKENRLIVGCFMGVAQELGAIKTIDVQFLNWINYSVFRYFSHFKIKVG